MSRRPAYGRFLRGTPRGGRGLTLFQQQFAMALAWPQFTCRRAGGRLVCRGSVRPRPGTREYLVRIEYVLEGQPVTVVESPRLEHRPDQPTIPHTYPPFGDYPRRPCLHHPEDLSWTPAKALAHTIVPWLLSWLVFYEIWLASGQWLGGGFEPGADEGAGSATGNAGVR